MIAALYIRVSTDEQLEFSPDAQKRALIEYAKKNNYQIDERYIFIDEGITGTSAKKRPAFQNMIATAKKKPKPFDAILVHKFDRFARSREDSVVYKSLLRKECGIKVISITEQLEDDKFSVILEAMLEAMAEYYSLNLSDEVIKGMTEKARRGGVQSKPILGYDIVDNKRLINKEEAETVKKIYEMCINGKSIGSIAKYLNALGIKSKTGSAFESRRIKYILQNPVYLGVTRWNYTHCQGSRIVVKPENEWITVENTHEPIISQQTWDEAQKILGTWHKDVKPRSTDYVHWLGGILRCSNCNGTLVYKTARFKRKDGSIRNADGYQCCRYKARSCNTSNYIKIKDIEEHILQILTTALHIVNETWSLEGLNIEYETKSDEIKLYQAQLSRLNHKLERAKKAYLNDIDTLEEYKANKEMLQREILEITNLIDNNKHNNTNPQKVAEFKDKLVTAIEVIKDDNINIMSKNTLLKTFIKSIIYNKREDNLTTTFYI